MKRIYLSILGILAALLALSAFVSCDKSPDVIIRKVTVMNGDKVLKEKSTIDGATFTLPSAPSEQSRTFAGWIVEGDLKNPGDEITVTEDITIEASWKDMFKVTVVDGEETVLDTSVTDGDNYTLPSALTEDGRTFEGWLVGKELKNPGDKITVTGDITIEASWNDRFSILVKNGQETVLDTSVTDGSTYTLPSALTEEGRTFEGWLVEKELKKPGDEIIVTENITINASWKNKFKVTVVNGDETVIDTSVTDGATYALPSALTEDGRTFKGWFVENELKNPGEEITVTEDITIEASWNDRFRVIVMNGEETVKDTLITDGTTYSLPSALNEEERTFEGWLVEEELKKPGDEITVTGNVTINASWKNKFKVTVVNGEETVLDTSVTDGATYALPSALTENGRTFEGWFVENELKNPGEEITVTEDITIEASWNDRFRVIVMNGEETVKDTLITDGTTYSLPSALNEEERTFQGWLVGKELKNPGDVITVTGNITINASWKNRFHVIVMNRDKTVKDTLVTDGDTYSLPSALSEEDKTFEGWLVRDTLKGPGEAVTVTGNLTITASWVEYCIVTFDTGGGSEVPSLRIRKGDTLNSTSIPVPTRSGYTFYCWKTESGTDFSFSTPITSDTVIKAEWLDDSKTATITLKDSNGNIIRKETAQIGSTYLFPTDLGYEIDSCTDQNMGIYKSAITITEKETILTVKKGKYKEYSIGDIGPGGGYIAYDAENPGTSGMDTTYSGESSTVEALGWRYIEIAPEDLSSKYVFGYLRSSDTGENIYVNANDDEHRKIGSGKTNTAELIKKMGDTAYVSETGSTKAVYAALAATLYKGGGYSDWFLPSAEEALRVMRNLIDKNLGNIRTDVDYWSSTEEGGALQACTAYAGVSGGPMARSKEYLVRPFRYF